MRKLVLVFIPLVLFAQVKIDTVIRLPSFLQNGCFIPELNKLYVVGWYEDYVLDCSTYQLRAQIPRSWEMGYGYFSWNRRRQKLYVYVDQPDSLMVIDAVADTVIRRIPIPGAHAYVASTDRLYVESDTSLYVLDCATDSVVRRIPVPVPGYIFCSTPSWDSVGNKLYVSLAHWGGPALMAVYDCRADSLLAVIDLGTTYAPWWVNFDQTYRKAYYAPDAGYAGVIDTRNDTIIRRFPFVCGDGQLNQVAVDTRDHKAYVAGGGASPRAETLYVIDCATDSIVKKVTYHGWPAQYVRWVPWSNRLYFANQGLGDTWVTVLDCNTDSVIVPELRLGYWSPCDIQLDPIHERIFAIGAESTSVHVLRDVVGGVVEEPASGLRPAPRVSLRESPAGVELEYHVESPCRVQVSVYDLLGRSVRTLVAENQPSGQHRVSWDRTDSHGTRVARGVYYILVNAGATHVPLKAVVR